jgi:hypothetical protein
MNLLTQKTPETAESARTTDQRVLVSEHFTTVDAFRWSLVLATPLVTLMRPAPANDPLGFSSERLAQGEADVAEGRVRSLDDVLNALRTRLLRNSG